MRRIEVILFTTTTLVMFTPKVRYHYPSLIELAFNLLCIISIEVGLFLGFHLHFFLKSHLIKDICLVNSHFAVIRSEIIMYIYINYWILLSGVRLLYMSVFDHLIKIE